MNLTHKHLFHCGNFLFIDFELRLQSVFLIQQRELTQIYIDINGQRTPNTDTAKSFEFSFRIQKE